MTKRSTGNLKQAVAYIRVSKEQQQLGPEAQRAAIEAWATREGILVVSFWTDHVCSVTPVAERPGLSAALASLRAQDAGILVVARRDRISRDPDLTGGITKAVRERGARLLSAMGEGNGDGASEVFLQRILDAKAELERADIRARTSAALRVKRSRGEVAGSVPLGFRAVVDETRRTSRGTPLQILQPDQTEQSMIAEAKRLAGAHASLRRIARELTAMGFRSRAGTPLVAKQVSRMLATLAGAAGQVVPVACRAEVRAHALGAGVLRDGLSCPPSQPHAGEPLLAGPALVHRDLLVSVPSSSCAGGWEEPPP